jgi:hypothetical protein
VRQFVFFEVLEVESESSEVSECAKTKRYSLPKRSVSLP